MMSGERNTKPIYVFTYGKEMKTHAILMQCNVYTNINICIHITYTIHYIKTCILCYYSYYTLHIHNDRTLYENSICYSSFKKWMEHVVL